MKNLALVAFAVLVSTTQAFAGGFTGTWEGPGQLVSTTGFSSPCTVISMTMDHTASALNIVSGKMACGQVQSDIAPTVLPIQGANIFYNNLVVGTISDTNLAMTYAEQGFSVGMSAIITGNQMQFNQSMSGQGNSTTITGSLTRK